MVRGSEDPFLKSRLIRIESFSEPGREAARNEINYLAPKLAE